jgi:hypothetical protein
MLCMYARPAVLLQSIKIVRPSQWLGVQITTAGRYQLGRVPLECQVWLKAHLSQSLALPQDAASSHAS